MKNMTAMNAKRKQTGFTIIELVVVILLLGILTATALPRFMDVTDEAHEAVVDAIAGGFATGTALFRAQWVAEGQPTDSLVSEYNLYASNTGYPLGSATTNTLNGNAIAAAISSDDIATATGVTLCAVAYEYILQTGKPDLFRTSAGVIVGTDGVAGETVAARETKVETLTLVASSTGEVVPVYEKNATAADSTSCTYYYVGQYRSGESATAAQRTIPSITYNFINGDVTRGTLLLATDNP